jgi:hypothetical protein
VPDGQADPRPDAEQPGCPIPSHRPTRSAENEGSSHRSIRRTDRTVYAALPADTTRISAASTTRDWPSMTTNPEPMAIAISQISR